MANGALLYVGISINATDGNDGQ